MRSTIIVVLLLVALAFGEDAFEIVRIKVNPKQVEPWKDFPLTAMLDDCGLGLIPSGNVEYQWRFENTEDGEDTDASGRQITHMFLSTGRKNVNVKACVGSFEGNDCDGTLYESRAELWVQYVRREIRDLSPSDWNLFVDAMWKLKTMSLEDLNEQYGEYATPYDHLIGQHFRAAFNTTCDQGHIWEAFHVFHRAFGIQMENAIQSIYSHLSLPYWDQNYDETTYAVPILDSEIWGDNYFGGVGQAANDYIVIDGRFGAELNEQGEYSGWNVASAEGILEDSYPRSPYNLLRSPINSNSNLPYSRNAGNLQGLVLPYPAIRFQTLDERAVCQSSSNFTEFHECQNQIDADGVGPHPIPHMFIGGADANINQSLTIEAYGLDLAFPMYIYRNVLGADLYYKGLSICDPCDDIDNCDPACRCAETFTQEQLEYADLISAQLGFDVPAILDPEDPRNICEIGGIMGDILDPATSPNDPMFHPFHADLDRAWVEWQLNHQSLGIYGDYPEVVEECQGHGLYDTLLGDSGWTGRELKLSDDDTYNIPVSELIERTSQPEFGSQQIASYRYQKYSAWGDVEQEPEDNYCEIILAELSSEEESSYNNSSYTLISFYTSLTNSFSSNSLSETTLFSTDAIFSIGSDTQFSSSSSSSSTRILIEVVTLFIVALVF